MAAAGCDVLVVQEAGSGHGHDTLEEGPVQRAHGTVDGRAHVRMHSGFGIRLPDAHIPRNRCRGGSTKNIDRATGIVTPPGPRDNWLISARFTSRLEAGLARQAPKSSKSKARPLLNPHPSNRPAPVLDLSSYASDATPLPPLWHGRRLLQATDRNEPEPTTLPPPWRRREATSRLLCGCARSTTEVGSPLCAMRPECADGFVRQNSIGRRNALSR